MYTKDFLHCGAFPICYDYTDKEKIKRDIINYMIDRTQGIFEYDGLPDSIPKYVLEFQTQVNGFTIITNKHDGNLYCYYGGLGGELDEYYRPTIATVSNPYQHFSDNLKIGEDCAIIRNDTLLQGLLPLFNRYAELITHSIISLRVASINSRKTSLITAPDDTTKAAAEKYQKDIEDGKTSIPLDDSFLGGINVQPLTSAGTSNSITQLIELTQYWLGAFYNEIGISAPYNMKRERLSESENDMNITSSVPLITNMLDTRRHDLEKVNRLYGTNITVRLADVWRGLDEISARQEISEDGQQEQLESDEKEVNENGADNGTN